jgi:hypothetical protein
MATRTRTYYDVLGIKPNAKHTEVGLAYNRLMRALRRDDAVPDLKAEAKLREAFEVLSDLDRREAYDRYLRGERIKPKFGKNHAAVAALFVVAAGAGLFWYLKPQLMPETVDVAAAPGKPFQEILNEAIPAVGRLQAVTMSGQAQPSGIAFTVEEGVAVTSCQGLPPNSQLSINLAPRVIPAKVTLSDEALGLCRLEVQGAGSWPLSVSTVAAKQGDRVYATQLTAKGEVVLREGKVKSVKAATPDGKAVVVDVSVPLLPEHAGAPLLDIYGRVVAVANMPDGNKGQYVAIPASWGETVKLPEAPKPYQGGDAPKEEAAGKAGEVDDLGVPLETRRKQEELASKIDPERRKRLEKAFRPPPSVPNDL